MTQSAIDLNADLGEGAGTDDVLLDLVSSVNLACGAHAGDPQTMFRVVRGAASRGVGLGAHPGYFDREQFGRRAIDCGPEEVYAICLYQIGALQALCRAEGTRVQHVKPHGALYNQAARSRELAEAIVLAVRQAGEDLVLLGLPGSEMERAAHAAGLKFAAEAFADRVYNSDGTLVPRDQPGAVIQDPDRAAGRLLEMVLKNRVEAVDGRFIPLRPQSICLHGDTPGAIAMAQTIRSALSRAGVAVKPLGELLSR